MADEAKALFFLDSDDWLAPKALTSILNALARAPRAAAAHAPFAFVAQTALPPMRPVPSTAAPRPGQR
jgi:hypothetical protein